MASGSSSSTETVWPWASIALATADPTRPQPTIRTNMSAALYSGATGSGAPAGAVRITLQGAFSTT